MKQLSHFLHLATLVTVLAFPISARAEAPSPPQPKIFEGQVTGILEEKDSYQKLEVWMTAGERAHEKIVVEVGKDVQRIGEAKYQVGDRVVLSSIRDAAGNDTFYITDFVRRSPLLWLFLIFVLLTAVVGKWQGLSSLAGMGLSFLVIFKFILPQISAGRDPILIAIVGSLLIIPLTFYLSHGFNKKTTTAVLGTLIALTITGVLAKVFVNAAHLTGYASDEAAFLQVAKQGAMNIKGLLLAGIIIGVLGILDDITIAQAAVVAQLRRANPSLKSSQLFTRAMRVGQDHIASMVNTLILVYTGAALPLLLLFIDNPIPFSQVINYEIIAEEIVRTLVGSIGLITAVPITTFLASRDRTKN